MTLSCQVGALFNPWRDKSTQIIYVLDEAVGLSDLVLALIKRDSRRMNVGSTFVCAKRVWAYFLLVRMTKQKATLLAHSVIKQVEC